MMLLHLAGAVALVLFGIRALRRGLDRLFGQTLLEWVQRTTESPFKSFCAGIVLGTFTTSSTAISLITIQMLNAGTLPFQRMLTVLLGANIGITMTVQLLALNVQNSAPVLLLIGVIGFQFCQRNFFRGIGQSCIGLGLIFLAMSMISHTAAEIPQHKDLVTLLHLAEDNPWIFMIIIMILTFLMQSSTASISLGLGLAHSQVVSGAVMVPWVLGANLGIACTSLAAGWSQLEARRLAAANLFLKGAVAWVLMLTVPRMTFGGMALTQLTAQLHTFFNMAVAGIGLAGLKPLALLIRNMVASEPEESRSFLPEVKTHLSQEALATPALALANSTRETLRMLDEIKAMLRAFGEAHTKRDAALARQVQQHDDRVDYLYHELTKYLNRIGQLDLDSHERWWQFTLLTFINELESAGDLLQKHLCDLIVRQQEDKAYFNARDEQRLAELHQKLLERLDMATSLLTTQKANFARNFLSGKETFNEWSRSLQKDHYLALQKEKPDYLNASAYFLEMLDAMRRINSHVSSIGYAFIPAHQRARKVNGAAKPANGEA
jgi:phosphate:Na+ symporter